MKAVRVHQYGGGEAMRYEDIPVPEPSAGEARVKIEAIGLHYIDIYQRSGLYQLKLPFTLGMEGAGIVDAVGSNVAQGFRGHNTITLLVSSVYRGCEEYEKCIVSPEAVSPRVYFSPVLF